MAWLLIILVGVIGWDTWEIRHILKRIELHLLDKKDNDST